MAQEFIHNPDYIYGVGYSNRKDAADTAALVSLARAIDVKVTSESVREVEESGRNFTERHFRRTNLTTSIKIEGAKKYVEKQGRNYVVYYYINKEEYIDERLRIYGTCLANIDVYEMSDDPHAINYILGSLYTAYVAMDDALLNALYKESVSYRNYALSELRRRYKEAHILLSVRETKARNFYEVREENEKPLPGFEYEDISGKWVSPSVFYDKDRMVCEGNPSEYKWAVVNMKGRKYNEKYRLTYEKEVAGRSVKISVPEEFYQDRYFIF